MANKTYNQYCAVAQALDIVGERWTLLIIRNLLAGPRRFSDLMKGLPGISTNILTDRLKTLESAATIQTRYLPPPAASTVYELSESGFHLVSALGALAQWGARSLGTPQDGQHIVTEGVIFMILGMFWKPHMPTESFSCRVVVEDEHFTQNYIVTVSTEGVSVNEMDNGETDFSIHTELEPLLRLSSQQITLRQAIDDNLIQIKTNPYNLNLLLEWVDDGTK